MIRAIGALLVLAAVRAGMFQLAHGPRKFSLMITGKSPQSTNYSVGIDRIVLTQSTGP